MLFFKKNKKEDLEERVLSLEEKREFAQFIVDLIKKNEARFRSDYRRDEYLLKWKSRKTRRRYPLIKSLFYSRTIRYV